MDWTGGSRRRYAAPKGNATIQKQKAHFARARIKMHNTPTSTRSLLPDQHYDASRRSTYLRGHTGTTPGRHGHDRGLEPQHSSAYRDYRDIKVDNRLQRDISQGFAAAVGTRNARIKKTVVGTPPPATSANAEELLLLVNRRKLLARSDWLSLAPTKPLQMHFPAAGDQDQVGRRRKIRKLSTHMAKPARPRLFTPIFEDRMEPRNPFQAGSLPPTADKDRIHIKIGTDAFASQSGASRQPGTPANQSVRRPSTDFGSLSEESMLLGEDGDTFDANQVRIPTVVSPQRASNRQETGSMYAYPGSQLPPATIGTTNAPSSSGISSGNDWSPFQRREDDAGRVNDTQPFHLQHPTSAGSGATIAKERRLDADFEDLNTVLRNRSRSSSPQEIQSFVSARDPGRQKLPPEPLNSALQSADHPGLADERADVAWKQWLGVPANHLGDASQIALVSSSEHITESSSACQLPRQISGKNLESSAEPCSTPPGVDSQSCDVSKDHNRRTLHHEIVSTAETQSPSASLAQIRNLAQVAGPHTDKPFKDDEDDDNAIWRQFIIGSQSSEPDVVHHRQASVEPDMLGMTSQRHPSPVVSGLGTSDQATQGMSLFVTDTLAPSSDAGKDNALFPTEMQAATSITSREAIDSLEVENDTTEDMPATQTNPRKNNHATSLVSLNPKRFKKGGRSLGNVVQKQPIRPTVTPRSKLGPGLRRRSVYDLVDSDGMSLS